MKRTPIVLSVILVVGSIAAVAAIRSGGPPPKDPGKSPPPGTQLLTHRWTLGIDTTQVEGGLQIALVLPRSAAEVAGLGVGDVIGEADGRSVAVFNMGETVLLERLNTIGPEEVLNLTVFRRGTGKRELVEVRIKNELAYQQELARNQLELSVTQLLQLRRPDGLWPSYADPSRPSVSVSALAAYALSRAGLENPAVSAMWPDVVAKILSHQNPNGSLNDPFTPFPHRVYASALLLMALAEAGSHEVERKLLASWLIEAQVQAGHGYEPFDWHYGGWSYYDTYDARLRTDISTARFAVQALAAADLADDHDAWSRARLFLSATQNRLPITTPDDPLHAQEQALRDGGFAFSPRFSKAMGDPVGDSFSVWVYRSTGSATADGALGLLAAGAVDRRTVRDEDLQVDDSATLAALRWLAQHYDLEKNPGFKDKRSAWGGGTHYYYLASLAETLHRAGVWHVVTSDGYPHPWAPEVARQMVYLHIAAGGRYANTVGLMHEDEPTLATSFAIVALAAARDRLETGGGAPLEAGLPVPPPPVRSAPMTSLDEGRALFGTLGCISCHADAGMGNGPSLVGIGEVYARLGDEAPARLRRYILDPENVGTLRKDEKTYGLKMKPLPTTPSDAELDALVNFLLSRLGKLPVAGQ